MKVLIVAGLPDCVIEETYDKYIGVDRGSLFLIKQGIPVDLAVGDFDSVDQKEYERIVQDTKALIKLPAEKDETDLEVALDYVLEHFSKAELTIMGALGGRLDHLLTNVFLVQRPKYQSLAPHITLFDQQNLVRYLLPGKHQLPKIERYKYIGFVQMGSEDTLAIEGAKYPLKAEENFSPIYASNEFTSSQMTVSLERGMVMVIYSGDGRKF